MMDDKPTLDGRTNFGFLTDSHDRSDSWRTGSDPKERRPRSDMLTYYMEDKFSDGEFINILKMPELEDMLTPLEIFSRTSGTGIHINNRFRDELRFRGEWRFGDELDGTTKTEPPLRTDWDIHPRDEIRHCSERLPMRDFKVPLRPTAVSNKPSIKDTGYLKENLLNKFYLKSNSSELDSPHPGTDFTGRRVQSLDFLCTFNPTSSQIDRVRAAALLRLTDLDYIEREARAVVAQMKGSIFYSGTVQQATARYYDQTAAGDIADRISAWSGVLIGGLIARELPYNFNPRELKVATKERVDRVDLCPSQIRQTLDAARIREAYTSRVAERADQILSLKYKP